MSKRSVCLQMGSNMTIGLQKKMKIKPIAGRVDGNLKKNQNLPKTFLGIKLLTYFISQNTYL